MKLDRENKWRQNGTEERMERGGQRLNSQNRDREKWRSG